MNAVTHLIAGQAVESQGEILTLINPSTAEKIGEVMSAGTEEVDRAIAVAKEAFTSWSETGLQYRADIILKTREILGQRSDEIVNIVMSEGGKTREDAIAEVGKGIETLSVAANVVTWYGTHLSHNVASGIDTCDMRFPTGVIAAIAPFNFPVLVPVAQAAMAIACGNTVISKPSEKVPTSFRVIAEMFSKAGLPDGVLNIVNGGRTVVERIIQHPDVDAITFVGSTPVAQMIRTEGVASNKKVQAFGSGKNHMVVLPDADLDMAADMAVSAGFGAAGQRCMAISVVVAVGSIGDELIEKMKQRIPHIKTGPTHTDGVQLGPVISAESKNRITSFVAGAESEGATLVVDGTESSNGGSGYHVGACLIDHVKPGMKVYDDEIFGPVLSVVRAESYEQAMRIIDGHPLGNGSAIFTRDGGMARQFVNEVKAGCVGVNIPIPVPAFTHSFGGWKGSAFTETKLTGPESLPFYTNIKSVTTRWPDPSTSSVDLGFPSNTQ